MKFSWIIALAFLVQSAIAQKNSIFTEAGTNINLPFERHYNECSFCSPAKSEGTNYTTLGTQVRTGINFGLTKKQKWNFSLPVLFSFVQIRSKNSYGISSNNANGSWYSYRESGSVSQNIACGIHPQLNFDRRRYKFYSNLGISGFCRLKYSGTYKYDYNGAKWVRTDLSRRHYYYMLLSYGLGFQYKFKRSSLGFNCDNYFFDPLRSYSRSELRSRWSRLLICPGIRYELRLF